MGESPKKLFWAIATDGGTVFITDHAVVIPHNLAQQYRAEVTADGHHFVYLLDPNRAYSFSLWLRTEKFTESGHLAVALK